MNKRSTELVRQARFWFLIVTLIYNFPYTDTAVPLHTVRVTENSHLCFVLPFNAQHEYCYTSQFVVIQNVDLLVP